MKKFFNVFVLTRHEQVVIVSLLLLWIAFAAAKHHRNARPPTAPAEANR